jgi:hypothetical protein
MHDPNKISYSGKLGHSAPVQESDRRGAGRVQFTVSADILETNSGARFSARTTDLSPGGCFVDTKIPFPMGTIVRVTLRRGNKAFDATGSVVYSQSGLGMGISFSDLASERREELAAWITELTGERVPLHDEAPVVEKGGSPLRTGDKAMLVRLIQLLIGKGLLTDAEGTSVLHDPLL